MLPGRACTWPLPEVNLMVVGLKGVLNPIATHNLQDTTIRNPPWNHNKNAVSSGREMIHYIPGYRRTAYPDSTLLMLIN